MSEYTLRVGTDCSGIEAPIQALRQLGIEHRHVFSSEIDKYCIQSIKANFDPELLFGDEETTGDITKRDIAGVPDIDLYVCVDSIVNLFPVLDHEKGSSTNQETCSGVA